MREIKFRGNRKDNDERVYGNLIINNAYDLKDGIHKPSPLKTFIQEQDVRWKDEPNDKCWMYFIYEVDPKTVGQYIGLKDKNGKESFHHDLISSFDRNSRKPIEIIWEDGSWKGRYVGTDFTYILNQRAMSMSEVIDDIDENPELFEESQ